MNHSEFNSYIITPNGKAVYEADVLPNPEEDSLYLRETITSNGRVYRVGTIDSRWKKFKQALLSAFSSTKYYYGRVARTEIDKNEELRSLISNNLSTICYTPDAFEGGLENENAYLRIKKYSTDTAEHPTYKVGVENNTWKKVKHFFGSIGSSTKYIYGEEAKKLVTDINNCGETPVTITLCSSSSSFDSETEIEEEISEVEIPLIVNDHKEPNPPGDDTTPTPAETTPNPAETTTPTPMEETIIPKKALSDSIIAKTFLEDDLDLLKESGLYFNILKSEITLRQKDTEELLALKQTLKRLQKYYEKIDHNPEIDNPKLKEALKNGINGINLLLGDINSKAVSKVKGIQNITNSCYMNSAMQALRALPAFMRGLDQLSLDSISDDNYRKVAEKAKAFMEAYANQDDPLWMAPSAAELREALFNAKIIDAPYEEKEPINPTALSELLFNLSKGASSEEAQQLYAFLIDSIKKTNPLEAQNDAIVVIDALIELVGQNLSVISTKTPIFNDFKEISSRSNVSSLPISLNDMPFRGWSLNILLHEQLSARRNSTPEEITFTYRFDEDEIFSTPHWSEKMELAGRPPPYITLQLNRLNGRVVNGQWTIEHIDTPIDVEDINQIFDLSYAFTNNQVDAHYRIKAAIKHERIGTGGHYTALVRKEEEWTLTNDEKVIALDNDQVKRQLKDSYIYFLERIY